MKITMKKIPIRDLVKNYKDTQGGGVIGYDGKLNIRPAYQREFVYKDKQREAVINTVRKGFPLNIMYWVKNKDKTFEVLDGQQRSISICQYVAGDFSINHQYFHNLEDDEREQILKYELSIYECEGNVREKLDWFKIVNIAGEKLTPQELRNAIYTGAWLSDAKKHFSRPGCVAYSIAKDYIKGSPIRQDFLETSISWIAAKTVDDYMAVHQKDKDANALWSHFQKVIAWIKITFPNYLKEMKGIDWGMLYKNHGKDTFNSVDLAKEVTKLMKDEDVTKKPGIYSYLITKEEKYLSIRSFSEKQKRESFTRQKGICIKCSKTFTIEEMEADHVTPWSKGGKTISTNCQMLCKDCNRTKSSK